MRIAQPVGAATFIGREVECATVVDLVAEARVVTLTGSGGCGKTRLAVEVLRDLSVRYADGARWVDLQGLSDPTQVPAAVAAALDSQVPVGRTSAPALVEQIHSQHLLIVLDNCEHLVGACAALVSELLRGCPRLDFLTTSRVPLLVDGETTFEVAPLAVPGQDAATAATVAAAPSAQLFVDRARQAVPDFRLDDASCSAVAEICRRVDGIPLAVELAAARVRVLALPQIASGLAKGLALLAGGPRAAPARQKTLEASLDWSYRLLDEAQRSALARLSVFAGSFELDAAEAVLSGSGVAADEALALVGGLVDQSLVQVVQRDDRARYRLLETIRVYGRQRLSETDEHDPVRRRHLAFYVGLAREAHAGITSADPEPWMMRLTADVDDLRAAMDWAAQCGDIAAVVDLTEPIDRFWFDRGAAEILPRLLVSADGPGVDEGERARGLVTAALGALAGGELVDAHRSACRAVEAAASAGAGGSQALALAVRAQAGALTGLSTAEEVDVDVTDAIERAEEGDDAATLAYVLSMGGWTLLRSSTIDAACRLLQRAIETCEEASFPFHLPAAHSVLGLWPVWSGRLEQTRSHAHQGRVLAEQVGRPGWTSVAWTGLGAADVLQGRHDAASDRLTQAQTGPVRGPYQDEFVRPWIAFAAYARHDFATAAAMAEQNIRVGRARGSRWDQALGEWVLGSIALHRGETGEAHAHLESSRTLSSAPRLAFTLGRSVLGLADVAQQRDDHAQAWELAHDALEVLDEYGDRVGTAEALETIAGLAAAGGDSERSLRLLAAAQRFRGEAGIARWPHCEQGCRRDDGAQPVPDGGDESVRLRASPASTLTAAVSYARRGRGARRRPPSGWDALTPAERAVVAAVAEGHTNAAIGRRLFISVNTVKKHLCHVYDKLEVEGRADLAAQAARRDRHPPRSTGDYPVG